MPEVQRRSKQEFCLQSFTRGSLLWRHLGSGRFFDQKLVERQFLPGMLFASQVVQNRKVQLGELVGRLRQLRRGSSRRELPLALWRQGVTSLNRRRCNRLCAGRFGLRWSCRDCVPCAGLACGELVEPAEGPAPTDLADLPNSPDIQDLFFPLLLAGLCRWRFDRGSSDGRRCQRGPRRRRVRRQRRLGGMV